MKMRTTLVLVCLLGFTLLSGCGNSDSPTEVVKSLYTFANDGKYSEAKSLLAKDAQNAVDGPLGQMVGGWKGICDTNTKSGTIKSIVPVSEDVRGEGATVVVTINFKDGSSKKNDKTDLIKEGGNWRITSP